MDAGEWSRKVFRLRRLPDHVCTPAAVASLLSSVLALPDGHVVVSSVARAAEIFEVPSRTATLQLKSVPARLRGSLADNEWSLPLADQGADTDMADVLVLDVHFEGMTVLCDPAPGKHHADCIAISGLASHPFGSWQPRKDKSFMWIRDAIPPSLPGVRTVIYGYGSKLPDSRSFQSIRDMARTLILHLKSGGWNLPSSKPIVFLAHSLGGMVLKEAIVQMADRDESISSILANVRGAVMFGVPSLGMEQSHLIAMVDGQANQSLVEDLSRYGSNYVRQLHTQFEGLSFLRKARILWAYETTESPTAVQRPDGSWDRSGPSTVLVNPASATSNYYLKNPSITIPIDKDHSGMVKFTRGDAHLAIINASIAEIYSTTHLNDEAGSAKLDATMPHGNRSPRGTNQARKDEDTIDSVAMKELIKVSSAVEEMHASLFSPELDFRVSTIEDPFQDTFEWVFHLPIFSKWLQEGSGLFWVHGKPGSGKSTLMKFILQNPQTRELLHNWQGDALEISAGFFFHYRGSAIQKSFQGVLRSLVMKILAPLWVPFRQKLKPRLEEFESAKQSLCKLRQKLKETQEGKPGNRDQAAHDLLRDEISKIEIALTRLENDFRTCIAKPETRFLKHIATVFQSGDDRLIPKLERVLRHVRDQNITKMDLVLFFDALDEFDGHPDMISRFIKSLVSTRSTSSGTRVKVCLSSRPWESFKVQFSAYPSFALQDHTQRDVEAYVAGTLAAPTVYNQAIMGIATDIIERANGVFLWVKLTIGLLLEAAEKASEGLELSNNLKQKLNELPSDLFEFYELIVERISNQNRRRTFALLELLIRDDNSRAEAYSIRDAVLLSECTTVDDAVQRLFEMKNSITDQVRKYDNVRSDVHTWSGGLVEIKLQDSRPRLQLMHQTVLEFVMGLWFKKMVVGDMAAILQENGHTFHLKYLMATRVLKVARALTTAPAPANRDPQERIEEGAEERREVQRLAYHAEQSELTTGKSHIGFLLSAPHDRLPLFGGYITGQPWSQDFNFLSFAASSGLTLCLRDWFGRGKDQRADLNYFSDPETPILPLLSSLIHYPVGGVFHERYLMAARLLLENGFKMAKDPTFFPMVLTKLWIAAGTVRQPAELSQATVIDTPRNFSRGASPCSILLSRDVTTAHISTPVLHSLAVLALDHGQDPNITISVFTSPSNRHECRPLHMATPGLARELIRHGADTTLRDAKGRAPLSWALEHPFELYKTGRLDCAQRYEMCQILVDAGGARAGVGAGVGAGAFEDLHISDTGLRNAISEFEGAGYDVSFIRELALAVGDHVRAETTSLAESLDGVSGDGVRVGDDVMMGLDELQVVGNVNAETCSPSSKQKVEKNEREKKKRWRWRLKWW